MSADLGWTGRLLVATPALAHETFHRTVVLLLQHAPEDGALGVVLNRPSGTPVEEVLPGWGALAGEPPLVFEGGPVSPTTAICVARTRAVDSALAPVSGAPLLATVDLDAPVGRVAAAVSGLRVFAGYAGWSPGQLEAERDEGSWWLLDALPGDPLAGAPELLWQHVLRRQGPPLAFAASYPADPGLN